MRRATVFAAVACLMSVIVLFVSALQDRDVDPTAKVKVVNVPACDFMVPNNDVGFHCLGHQLFITDGGGQYVRAPLVMPNNSKITKLVLVCKDNDASTDITCWLHRSSNNFSVNAAVASVKSSGASTAWKTFSANVSGVTLDNAQYLYVLNVYLPESVDLTTGISHVKVYYSGKW